MQARYLSTIPLLFLTLSAPAQPTVQAPASTRYDHPFITQKIFIGGNYRKTWSTPVAVKVFHMSSTKGGFKVIKLGGGMQTKSLHMEDKAGTKWVLRTVDKTVDKAMQAEGIRSKFIQDLSQNMISAAMPYAALTLPPMAAALGIPSTASELYFVQDDPEMGEYRKLFANAMCLLELQEPTLHKGDDVSSTPKMRKKLAKHEDYRLDQQMLLQARLLDMLVADWDRHGDQWKWGYHKTPDGKTTVYPIPRDHDQTYFNSNGVLFTVTHLLGVHKFVGFKKSLKLRPLNYKAWPLDTDLMPDLTEADWRDGALRFRSKLTDEVLQAGVRQLPPEVYKICGDRLYGVLRHRRDRMPAAAVRYYRFLKSHPKKVAEVRRKIELRSEKTSKLKGDDDDDDK